MEDNKYNLGSMFHLTKYATMYSYVLLKINYYRDLADEDCKWAFTLTIYCFTVANTQNNVIVRTIQTA
jgi:hypothetical protein